MTKLKAFMTQFYKLNPAQTLKGHQHRSTHSIALLNYCENSVGTAQLPGVCYMYGNRHLIPFAQQPGGDHAQYLCQQNGDQTLISNKYVLGTVNVTTNPSWNENFRFEFYEESGELICIITSQNYRCDDASRHMSRSSNQYDKVLYSCFSFSISVVIHRSLTAVHIYYRYSPTEDLRIEIIIYGIGGGRTVNDIQIMQHDSLIHRSSGLCVAFSRTCDFENGVRGSRRRTFTATLAAQLCSIFLKKAYNKIKELFIPASQTSVSHAKAACIRDLRVSNNKAFATSMIVFLLHDGLYRKTMNNVLFGNQALQIVQAIKQASASAHREAMTLITNTTMNLA
ncbi:unnamed protein product [Rotaria sordida]|uniref:C2 domain-containing protein n=1 Tax=Rotaria sordida TaxID=392033 RepID=A0A815I7C7_9BILA|nr:unnamed protein product [Rotaria sordida]CAF1359991.1 unnamed protein product [Rotaria sordida]